MDRQARYIICAAWALAGGAAAASAPEGIEHVTRPSKDVTLSFVRPGRIAKIEVTEGQEVKAGQVLVRQDDAAEQANLAQLKEQAEDMIRIDAAKAQLAQKRVDVQKLKWAADRGAATEFEVRHAELDVTIAELTLKLKEFERAQDQRKYQEAKLHVERMQLRSPIDGRVEKVFVEAGESIDALQEVVRVVQIDPLWIELPVPLPQATRLKVGGGACVAFDAKAPARPNGKIVHVASVADAASDTLAVRVEVPNDGHRPAGQRVVVSFPQPQTKPPPPAADQPAGGPSNPGKD